MKNIFKNTLLSTVVFGIAIASGFAMDNNPPTEPVKKILETEIVTEEAPTTILDGVAYMDGENCVGVSTEPLPPGCSTTGNGPACTAFISGLNRHLYKATYDNVTKEWICINPLFEEL